MSLPNVNIDPESVQLFLHDKLATEIGAFKAEIAEIGSLLADPELMNVLGEVSDVLEAAPDMSIASLVAEGVFKGNLVVLMDRIDGGFLMQPSLSKAHTTIGDELSSCAYFSSFASEAEEMEVAIVEGLYSESMSTAAMNGAGQIFKAHSIESSLEGVNENIKLFSAQLDELVPAEAALGDSVEILSAEVTAAEVTVTGAVEAETVAAETVTAAVAAESGAIAAEAVDWWTIIGGIVTGVAISGLTAAVIVAKKRHDEAQQKKKDSESNLSQKKNDYHEREHELSTIKGKRNNIQKQLDDANEEKKDKEKKLEIAKNKIKANILIHKLANSKLWLIKLAMMKKKGNPSQDPILPSP